MVELLLRAELDKGLEKRTILGEEEFAVGVSGVHFSRYNVEGFVYAGRITKGRTLFGKPKEKYVQKFITPSGDITIAGKLASS